ncbi:calcium-binding protein [Actinoplanes sp. NPDC049668]|uniref:calcium-binding protein n=1 Tax=unclassified Actinoplanes TaxID=2626549 RepID=UPI0033BB95BA
MASATHLSRIGMVLLTTIGVGVLASPAEAASTGVVRVVKTTEVEYKAAVGKANKIVITRSGRTVTIDDNVRIKAGKGCKAVRGDKTKVRCKLPKNPTRVRIYSGTRNDTVTNKTGIASLLDGGSGSDRLYGGAGGDVLTGGTGNDTLHGRAGNDRLYGNEHADKLYGGDGNDALEGGLGNDLLSGGAGDDRLEGDVDPEDSHGSYGADVLLGGSGRDTVDYYRAQATVDLDGAKGDDGAPGERDTVGTDVENITGGDGDNVFTGNGAANRLTGGEGKDVFHGGGGNDELYGSYGSNRLYGDAGDDTIYTRYVGDEPHTYNADEVDGGANTAVGDLCHVSPIDVVAGCERLG